MKEGERYFGELREWSYSILGVSYAFDIQCLGSVINCSSESVRFGTCHKFDIYVKLLEED